MMLVMDKKGLTIAEAATLLGVHKNTIRNRIKDGTYKAEKVFTERGPMWIVERDSLLDNSTNITPTSGSQVSVTQDVKAALQAVLEPFVKELGSVREELGRERALREQAEQRISELEYQLEAFRAVSESPVTASEEEEKGQVPAEPETEKSEPWWRRIFK